MGFRLLLAGLLLLPLPALADVTAHYIAGAKDGVTIEADDGGNVRASLGGNFPTASAELFGKGAPLRIGPMLKLETVSTTDIAAARFELPRPVIESIEFPRAITPEQGGGGLPPLA